MLERQLADLAPRAPAGTTAIAAPACLSASSPATSRARAGRTIAANLVLLARHALN